MTLYLSVLILTFNSSKVQLEQNTAKIYVYANHPFNSSKVQLELQHSVQAEQQDFFQFQ